MKPIMKIAGLVAVALATILAQQPKPARGGGMISFTLTTSAFASGAEIPQQYSCKGADDSPALQWSGAPGHAASFALIMDDPDAPAGTWVHWVLWNLPANAQALPEGVPKREQLDNGARQGGTASTRRLQRALPACRSNPSLFLSLVCAGRRSSIWPPEPAALNWMQR